WGKTFPGCNAENQSPIDIDTTTLTYDSGLTAFDWSNYGAIPRNARWELINNGHSAQLVLDGDYQLWDGGLDGIYKAVHASLSWGSEDHIGSEHLIDGRGFPAELQIVHYSLAAGSYDEALHVEKGIAIMSFLFRLSPVDNRVYDQILLHLERIPYKDEKVIVRPLPLLSLLPLNLNNYFRYSGTFTSPPCTPGVIWSVFEDHIDISLSQRLRKLLHTTEHSSNAPTMLNNFRPTQALGSRVVYASDPKHSNLLTSPLNSPISITVAVLVGFIVMFFFINRSSHEEVSGY
ncbi:hypothetical protein CAPTEDRAFT_98539, partial [Capitella teleta]